VLGDPLVHRRRVGAVVIRPGRPDEVEQLRDVEREAGHRFADVGLADVAAHEPMAADVLAGYAADGRCWVALDDDGAVTGYVIVEVVDGCAHVEQISVLPGQQGRGHGRRLLDEVERWAAGKGLTALTLTTFANVPWNRPLYEHLGFRVLAEAELTPPLVAIRRHEADLGLDPSTRVVMRRDLRR
jgi:GNAT superfamily N-acetyltransferase